MNEHEAADFELKASSQVLNHGLSGIGLIQPLPLLFDEREMRDLLICKDFFVGT